MPKIKNWKKAFDEGELIKWVRKDGLILEATKENRPRPWKLRLKNRDKADEQFGFNPVRTARTKSKIRKEASDFMRKESNISVSSPDLEYEIV